jgi:hypothetical protein
VIQTVRGSESVIASSEARFTDASAHGLMIVPASCPSNPDYAGQCSCTGGSAPLSEDAQGFKVRSGTADIEMNKNAVDYCVTNGSGNNFFIPAKTSAETTSFINSISRFPGVSIRSHQ